MGPLRVPSIAPQRFRRIDAEATPRGPQCRENADEKHERRRPRKDAGDRQAADLLDRHVAAYESGGEQAGRRAGADLPERALEHRRDQLPWRSAQRGANADLAPALRDCERHERIQACGREQQEAAGNRRDRESAQVVSEAIRAINLGERLDLVDVQRRVDLRDDVTYAFRKTGRSASQAKLHMHWLELPGRCRVVGDACVGRHGQIAGDPDDLIPAIRPRPLRRFAARCAHIPETMAERVAAGRERLSEVAVNDNRVRLREWRRLR